jgi:hypothetical protein
LKITIDTLQNWAKAGVYQTPGKTTSLRSVRQATRGIMNGDMRGRNERETGRLKESGRPKLTTGGVVGRKGEKKRKM